ncbi:acyltransferase family protein [Sphingomonas sp. ASY06-1R]|uniref:acyltransferase family protein n=1 Tax=Sphingomonas sp. ASY06-1R TaxID=3445771 RepID=UPI003FA25CE3
MAGADTAEAIVHPDATAAGKPHFEVLDGLRGSAALLVVLFHIQGIPIEFDGSKVILHHAPLAVDFFFGLSGFVIGYAYDDRWARMSIARFIKIRLIRLHPLLVLGALLGFASYLLDPFAGARQAAPFGAVAWALVMMLLSLPSRALPNRWDDTHTLNGPEWTLFWEYVANLAYALVLRRLAAPWLLPIMVLGAIALIWTGLARGSLDGGWGWSNLWMAAVRLTYPFVTGLFLYRIRHRLPRIRLGFLPLTAVLTIAMLLPIWPEAGGIKWNGLYEAALIILLFPAVIVAGAHSDAGRGMMRLCQISGRLSFPLYITHYPFMYIYMNWIFSGPSMSAILVVATAALLFVLAFAWLAFEYWDKPIRAWLKQALR